MHAVCILLFLLIYLSTMTLPSSLDITSIKTYYQNGGSPFVLFDLLYRRIVIDEDAHANAWISLRSQADIHLILEQLISVSPSDLPLWGIPFSVKDNIDVLGLATTAACPAFSYIPKQSAVVVDRLERAGAICLGKTNLDQFATGLNGTRSPYGPCTSVFHSDYISGGSSSGSAVSVALHQVCFSIGTDTGGSGRIPASLNNIVGLKPTCGTLSTLGLVPCCPSVDCPSVFALSVADALEVASVMSDLEPSDSSLRADIHCSNYSSVGVTSLASVLVPSDYDLEFFGNEDGKSLYLGFLDTLEKSGLTVRQFNFSPFREAGSLLFDGPFIADRFSSIGPFVQSNKPSVLETTSSILSKASAVSGADVFKALVRIKQLKVYVQSLVGPDDLFLFPTLAPLYTVSQMLANPVELNSNIGHYSYFANILDLSALSVPIGFYPNGMPFGITLMGLPFRDSFLAQFAISVLGVDDLTLGLSRT